MDQRKPDLSDACLALGGLFQATALVHQVATQGRADPDQVAVCLASVLNLSPENLDNIYAPAQLACRPLNAARALRHGLQFLRGVLGGKAPQTEPLRLAVAVLQLERRFQRLPDKQQALGRELELLAHTEGVRAHPEAGETIVQLADAWVQHLGGIQPRIMVSGNPTYLQDRDNQSLIRSLLLAGLRAAVLWRQVGGSRWRLLWQRKAYLRAAEYLLAA